MKSKNSTTSTFSALFTLFSCLFIGSISVSAYSAENTASLPKDKGLYLKNGQVKKIYKAMLPHIRHARATYPHAKKRWLKGLPENQYFFVVTRIRDNEGVEEQVFISVSRIRNGFIKGFIYSKPKAVSNFQFKQPYVFREDHVIDWVISKPNGDQEGNYVGKFLSGLN